MPLSKSYLFGFYLGTDCDSFVALHGLGNGHAFDSFRDFEKGHMWLIDDLRHDFNDHFRIAVYGYDTGLYQSISHLDLETLASDFRLALQSFRRSSLVRVDPTPAHRDRSH
jgi:hypothetical protein